MKNKLFFIRRKTRKATNLTTLWGATIVTALVLIVGNPAGAAMKSDAKNGAERQYYEDGKIRLETRFKNGLMVRKRAFYRNGQLKVDYRYKNGEPVKVADYYEDGHLQSLWTKKSGQTKYYNPDGTMRLTVDTQPERANQKLKSSYIFSNGR